MNILPKKSWHVRRKHNIERVRKDEAEALEKEIQLQKRRAQYETESKLVALREAASSEVIYKPAENANTWTGSHINFFENIEKGEKLENFVNEEKEQEKKKEIENWEKKMGILTYLGQSVVDGQKNTPWYLKKPEKISRKEENLRECKEIDHIFSAANQKKKEIQYALSKKVDKPMGNLANDNKKQSTSFDETLSYLQKIKSSKSKEDCHKDKKKSSKVKKRSKKLSSSSSTDSNPPKKVSKVNLDTLRLERIQRENRERIRAENLLRTEGILPPSTQTDHINNDRYYNSQFNPDIIHDMRKK